MAKKILAVDDEPDILKVVIFRLKKIGYEVITAIDGKEALDLAERERPDLILLDLRLPIINGYEVCQKIKADEKLKKIPVILLTASTSSEFAEKMKEYQADDYLVKPFEPEELLTKIKKFIG